jgi:hypothetical protein
LVPSALETRRSCSFASDKNLERKKATPQKVANAIPKSNDERSKRWGLAASIVTTQMTKARQKKAALILQSNLEVWLEES